jgi:uncharacterized protein HemX
VSDAGVAVLSAVAAIIAATGGIIGAGLTAWVQQRRETGSVRTSDAQTLFTSANTLIQMLLQSTQTLTERLDQMAQHFDTLADRVEKLVQQQDELLRLQRDQTRTLHKIENGGGLGKE